MTLIKKPIAQKKKIAFDTMVGIFVIIIVMACVAIFLPMLITPLLR